MVVGGVLAIRLQTCEKIETYRFPEHNACRLTFRSLRVPSFRPLLQLFVTPVIPSLHSFVSSANAPSSTTTIAATNTAKRCQAGFVSPAGTGVNQMPNPNTNGNARRTSNPELVTSADLLPQAPCQAGSRRTCPSDRQIDLA